MNCLIAKGLNIATHLEGKKTISNPYYILVDFKKKRILTSTSGSQSITSKDFILENDEIKYQFTVINKFGEYKGDAILKFVPTTTFGKYIMTAEYSTDRGSEGKIFYHEFYHFHAELTEQSIMNIKSCKQSLEEIFEYFSQYGPTASLKMKDIAAGMTPGYIDANFPFHQPFK
jgi:hypothetical protein